MLCSHKLLVSLALIISALQVQAASQRLHSALDDSKITSLRGNIPHFARVQNDRGPVSPSKRIEGASIVFNRSAAQQVEVESLLRQQQDPASPNYHKWLTPQQYADRFGMSQGDIDKVSAWLRAHGLRINRVSASRNQIFFSGTAAQMQAALHTELRQFEHNGKIHFSNSTEPAVPAALAGSVLAIRNLNDFRPRPRRLNARKVSPNYTSGGGNHFISPDDLATIYNINPLYGAGITGSSAIAVVGQTQIAQSDISAFRSASGLPVNPFQAVLVPDSGTSVVVDDDELEADLDVEWTGAVARDAAIFYVYTGNNSNFNVIDSLQYSIDQNIAPVISVSYGLCEASAGSSGRSFLRTLAQQAIAQGQTISAASGDDGAADCEDVGANSATHGLAVDLPAALPEVTGVGGTEFSGDVATPATYWSAVNNGNGASALSYIPEAAWNDTDLTVADGDGFASGGGGRSAFFTKPSFQSSINLGTDTTHRYVPDISLNASARHDGYLVCSQGSCVNGFINSDNTILLAGGTSVGAPVFAGLLGLINQATQSSGLGNANLTLYPLSSSHPNAFHDITTGNNKVPCTSGSTDCSSSPIGYSAAAGYDLATGLGSLNMFNLVSAWPGFTAASDYSVSSNPATIPVTSAGASGTAALTISSATGFTGAVALTCEAIPNLKISCSVSPTSVNLSGTTTSADATLTVTTVAAQGQSFKSNASLQGGKLLAIGSMILAGVFAFAAPVRRRKYGTLCLFLFAIFVSGVGCGGGSSAPSTPSTPSTPGTAAGQYTVVVKGTSGSVVHSANVKVTVP
jgi:subtilase family serine protease